MCDTYSHAYFVWRLGGELLAQSLGERRQRELGGRVEVDVRGGHHPVAGHAVYVDHLPHSTAGVVFSELGRRVHGKQSRVSLLSHVIPFHENLKSDICFIYT